MRVKAGILSPLLIVNIIVLRNLHLPISTHTKIALFFITIFTLFSYILRNFVSLNFTFDIICISESKILKDIDPIVDISIDGYQAPISVPTEATKGGVLIYVKIGMKYKPRNDLKMYKSKELESTFIEIINDKDSNDIIGVIYRHPSMIESEFIDDHLNHT